MYVRLRAFGERRKRFALLAGVLVALSALMRPVHMAAVFPFGLVLLSVAGWREKLTLAGCLLGPLSAGVIMTLLYNRSAFGEMTRTGYQFWSPVPYDYSRLAFSPAYIAPNLRTLWATGLPLLLGLLALALGVSHRLRKPATLGWRPLCAAVEFLVLAAGPTVALYLIYFWREPRFYLPALSVTAVLVGAVVGGWLSSVHRVVIMAVLSATVLIISERRSSGRSPPPHRRLAAERIRRETPDTAIIISAIEPVYLEYVLGKNSRRQIVPLSRNIEYANKVIAPRKVENPIPPPKDALDSRCAGLLNGGAVEAVPYVATEKLDDLRTELMKGRRVFVETTGMNPAELRPLIESRHFRFVQLADSLYEMELQ